MSFKIDEISGKLVGRSNPELIGQKFKMYKDIKAAIDGGNPEWFEFHRNSLKQCHINLPETPLEKRFNKQVEELAEELTILINIHNSTKTEQ